MAIEISVRFVGCFFVVFFAQLGPRADPDAVIYSIFLSGTKTGDVAQLVKHPTVTPLMQVQFLVVARDFSPRVKFQCRFSYVCPHTPCVIAYMYICAHINNPVVHVRVWWIMETTNQLAL